MSIFSPKEVKETVTTNSSPSQHNNNKNNGILNQSKYTEKSHHRICYELLKMKEDIQRLTNEKGQLDQEINKCTNEISQVKEKDLPIIETGKEEYTKDLSKLQSEFEELSLKLDVSHKEKSELQFEYEEYNSLVRDQIERDFQLMENELKQQSFINDQNLKLQDSTSNFIKQQQKNIDFEKEEMECMKKEVSRLMEHHVDVFQNELENLQTQAKKRELALKKQQQEYDVLQRENLTLKAQINDIGECDTITTSLIKRSTNIQINSNCVLM